jgi:K+-transporting ATPase ATPase C chain
MYLKSLRISVLMWLALTVLFGGVYPGAVTVCAKLLFPAQAEGSLIMNKDSKPLGSRLIGQNFADPKHFWGRLSATTPQPYNAASSTGSNYGVNNQALLDAAKARAEALKKAEPGNTKPIPVDLVTASGSGLDPHISIAAAEYQAGRVAAARGLGYDEVKALVAANTEGRQFGVLGEPVVNVLALNLALDGLAAKAAQDLKPAGGGAIHNAKGGAE